MATVAKSANVTTTAIIFDLLDTETAYSKSVGAFK